jgi:hypothetical protein
MANVCESNQSVLSLVGVRGIFSILWRYFREKAVEQIKSVWFIIAYLIFFQAIILDLPIVYSATIATGLLIVVMGLTFFMEGLRLGLMPFGETIGAILPRNSSLPMIMLFAFILGVGATFAEPAISILKKAGGGVSPEAAPLLYSILNDFSGQLVMCVGFGVGCAVTLGVLRFFYGWSMKILIIPIVTVLLCITLYCYFNPILNPVIGLAWDCGAVTTGPVTVPLVLALGIGVCRIINDKDNAGAGFGIVTLASLFPILAVLSLSLFHYFKGDYYGADNYLGEIQSTSDLTTKAGLGLDSGVVMVESKYSTFSQEDYEHYLKNGTFPSDEYSYRTVYKGGEILLENGSIVHRDVEIHLERIDDRGKIESILEEQAKKPWDYSIDILAEMRSSLMMAGQAILPLCAFLFLTLLIVLKEKLRRADEISVGVIFAVFGMALFGLGLTLGLTPLGTQLGSNIPVTFASITPWGLDGTASAIFENEILGKLVAILFAFFLGYGATLAEPALNALGETVEKTTVGVFRKSLLMQNVAIGVGMGIAAGVAQMAFPEITLTMLLIPPYLLLIVLTLISSEEFVNFAWDSAGVTTGPITVPLVLAMGLGIGDNIPGVIDGFGILALASVGPIITVLTVGLIVNKTSKSQDMILANDEGI